MREAFDDVPCVVREGSVGDTVDAFLKECARHYSLILYAWIVTYPAMFDVFGDSFSRAMRDDV